MTNYREVYQDLFALDDSWHLAHCITGDYSLGAGVAKVFADDRDMRTKLNKQYPIVNGAFDARVGTALLVDNVFNLVTKTDCYAWPTLDTMRDVLEDMAMQCAAMGIEKLAMPQIGCGRDRLDWDDVYELIQDIFEDLDIEILVCTY